MNRPCHVFRTSLQPASVDGYCDVMEEQKLESGLRSGFGGFGEFCLQWGTCAACGAEKKH